MKVYSWKRLIITLIFFIIAIKDLMAGDSLAIAYIPLWIYILIRGLWASLNEDGFTKDKLSEDIYKRVVRELFGKWSFIGPWVGLILMIFALILLKIMPSQKWFPIIISIIGILYQFVFSRYVNKEIKKEKKNYFL
ncbi:hypothetical protein [Tissierella sp.]|uniref:hypothetical protein n=1 Tax=Tissierella sp. TaxID=41274 RepID=UPI00285461C1|nr:hypothetical protein [Tissierella sp.]MDR7855370.1 hypothetical protein [Tissierella sp.]